MTRENTTFNHSNLAMKHTNTAMHLKIFIASDSNCKHYRLCIPVGAAVFLHQESSSFLLAQPSRDLFQHLQLQPHVARLKLKL